MNAPLFEIVKVLKGGPYLWAETFPPHPRASSRGRVLLHRVIAENQLGRLLARDEVVHHKDENGHNNAIDNLEVMTRSEHSKHHAPLIDRIHVTCGHCGRGFELLPCTLRKRTVVKRQTSLLFCSKSCYGKWWFHSELNQGVAIKRRKTS